MRRISRLDKSIGLLQAKSSASHSPLHLCSACTPQATSFSTSLRNAEQDKQPIFTEKIRRKIWGTDNPPGSKDPYGDASVFDKTKTQEEGTAANEILDFRTDHKEATKVHKDTKKFKKSRKDSRSSRLGTSIETTPASTAANETALRKRQFRAVERNLRSYIKGAGELDESYVPAENANGLLEVGPLPPRWGEVWDKCHPVPSFLPARRETDGEIITAALHRAIVEVLALKKSGEKDLAKYTMALPSGYDFTDYVQISSSPTGPVLQFSTKSSLEQIVNSVSRKTPPTKTGVAGVLRQERRLASRTLDAYEIEEEQAARAAVKEQKRLAYEEDQARRRAEWLAAGGKVQPKNYVSGQAQLSGVDETKEKVAPTESEEGVAADRSTVDPLQSELKPSEVDETADKENPTESEEDVAADRSNVDPLEKVSAKQTHAATITSWNPSWLHVPLTDPDIKFAVIKRTMQLTGVRLSDSVIQSANTAQALLCHFITLPKPRKLAEALLEKEKILNLPNVSIHPRRLVPSDKETSVGRWKVIEKELMERGLPVFGRG